MRGFTSFMGGLFFVVGLALAVISVGQPAILGQQFATLAVVSMVAAVYLGQRGREA